jgi:hypothetical protein
VKMKKGARKGGGETLRTREIIIKLDHFQLLFEIFIRPVFLIPARCN